MQALSNLILHDLNLNAQHLIGVDEVGRGCLAGPVYAGAVHFEDLESLDHLWLGQINDSKKIKASKRKELCEFIKLNSCYSLGQASVEEIECAGILGATLMAMQRAINQIIKQHKNKEFLVLVDGISKIKTLKHKQITIKKGDANSLHIAAASIIAKTERDDFMSSLSTSFEQYLPYQWHQNVGYGTKKHVQAILEHGSTPLHRVKFLRKINAMSVQQRLSIIGAT